MKKDTGLPKSAPRLHEKFLMDLGATSTCLPRFLMDLGATSWAISF